ncbi:hypothetical protein [Flavobacterium sp. 140616W15]|uniref:hypothetical protein n=1 Tax=Flavobacterium sp. 140616W15 TaxID=2478552 RepID=UPI000F0CA398|nr:hypothetical protein [Flavobacterium sp. 140616W15]AYN03649.1 hypothetical protein EAG11_05265 [Flavobacterium sp. 140616W15]
METKEVLVYDNQHGFSRFLKKQFGKDINFKVYKKFSSEDNFDNIQEEYSFIFFIVYSGEDLFDFIKLQRKGVPIVVCSFNKEVLYKFKNIDDISLLDISASREELINNFQMALHTYSDAYIN